MTTWRSLAAGTMVALLLGGVSAAAQESRSAPLARELTKLLDAAQLETVAARHPDVPDEFVAALYFPGSQLLVVSARYEAPSLLNEKIMNRDYREVYIDLHSAAIPGSRVFVEDLRADGLRATRQPDEPYDRYEDSERQLSFDGDWRRRRISEAEYMQAFTEADARYADMLRILIQGLGRPGS